MKAKSSKIKQMSSRRRNDGIVGVIGSIPFASTTLTPAQLEQGIEIPKDCELVPGIRTVGRRKVFYQVLRKIPRKRFEKGLNNRKRLRA